MSSALAMGLAAFGLATGAAGFWSVSKSLGIAFRLRSIASPLVVLLAMLRWALAAAGAIVAAKTGGAAGCALFVGGALSAWLGGAVWTVRSRKAA